MQYEYSYKNFEVFDNILFTTSSFRYFNWLNTGPHIKCMLIVIKNDNLLMLKWPFHQWLAMPFDPEAAAFSVMMAIQLYVATWWYEVCTFIHDITITQSSITTHTYYRSIHAHKKYNKHMYMYIVNTKCKQICTHT